MAVFSIQETSGKIFWTLHDNSADPTSGDLGPVLAAGPEGFDALNDALTDVDRVRLVAPGAEVVIEETVQVLSQGNIRVGSPRVEARRIPATALASPSPLATEVDTDVNVEEEDDAGSALVATGATGAQARRPPSTGGTVRAQTGRSTKARPPRAKPASGR